MIPEHRAQPRRASAAVRDGRLWRRRTVHQRQCRGVQPADRFGSRRPRRYRSAPSVPCRPYRTPEPSGARYPHRRPAAKALPPTAAPTAASAHRSLGHASYGSCPAAPQIPPATNRAATGAVHGPATVNATSASPCAPTARNAHCANAIGQPDRYRLGYAHPGHASPGTQTTRNRRQPPIDRRRRISLITAITDRIHVATRPTRQRRLPTCRQEPQQHINIHLRQTQLLASQPPRERQQVIGVGPAGSRGEIPVSQIPQEFVDQSELLRGRSAQLPDAVVVHSHGQFLRHEMYISHLAPPRSRTTGKRRVEGQPTPQLAG